MYAVIESGGKQHRVELGSRIQVDRLDVQPGDSITLERVLLVADGEEAAIGRPLVDGAAVSAEVLGQDRGRKIVVFKYKPKARTRVKKGFRAELTTLRITDITFGGKSAAKDAEKALKAEAKRAREAEESERAAAERAAAEKAAADKALAAKLAAREAEPAPAKEVKPKAARKKTATKAAAEAPTEEAPTEEAPTAEAEPTSATASESEVVPEAEAGASEADTEAETGDDASEKDE